MAAEESPWTSCASPGGLAACGVRGAGRCSEASLSWAPVLAKDPPALKAEALFLCRPCSAFQLVGACLSMSPATVIAGVLAFLLLVSANRWLTRGQTAKRKPL